MPNLANIGRLCTTPNGQSGFVGEVYDNTDFLNDRCRVYVDGGGYWNGTIRDLTFPGGHLRDYEVDFKKWKHPQLTAEREDATREYSRMTEWCYRNG